MINVIKHKCVTEDDANYGGWDVCLEIPHDDTGPILFCIAETEDEFKANAIVSAARLTLEYALPAWRQETLDSFKKVLDSNPNL